MYVSGKRAIFIGLAIAGALLIVSFSLLKHYNGNSPDVAKQLLILSLYVAPDGDDAHSGDRKNAPLKTIQAAFTKAKPGTKISIADGTYIEQIKSVRNGTPEMPIVLSGSRNGLVRAPDPDGRLIEINHDFIQLQGFSVDGLLPGTDGNAKEHYTDKLIYVTGKKPKNGITGLKIDDMLVQNAGGECIRLRYLAENNVISNSDVKNCGAYDFKFNGGGKNGEGIYIGTAPEQIADGKNPTEDIDTSHDNRVFGNNIVTNGNECVDIKEGAHHNTVENNLCSRQLDEQSGGFDARGNQNTFRGNTVYNVVGVGFRLGGDEKRDGKDNNIIKNKISNAAAGGIRTTRPQQGRICGNTFQNISSELQLLGFERAQNVNISCN